MSTAPAPDHDVVIVGAGFSGIGAAVKLDEAGVHDYLLIEAGDGLGGSLPGFPNFFLVCGPYGFVGSSFFALIEAQTHHIVRCLRRAARQRATRVEVTEAANARYFDEMMRSRRFPLSDYRFTA